MSAIRLKCRWTALWLLAAALVVILEFYAIAGRANSAVNAASSGEPHHSPRTPLVNSTPIGTVHRTSPTSNSAILVLGNTCHVSDGELHFTVTATRIRKRLLAQVVGDPAPCAISTTSPEAGDVVIPVPGRCEAVEFSTPIPDVDRSPNPNAASRVYFLQTTSQPLGSVMPARSIECRLQAENPFVRVYVDRMLPVDQDLADLIEEIDQASKSSLAEVMRGLVGDVCDIDQDGHLAIVLTHDIAPTAYGRTPVDGLTQPGDFDPDLERPQGNGSDVIFLNSRLKRGNHLRAVLAHEWCHAALFSHRQSASGRHPMRTPDEDWLNEAVAHVVEVRASGSTSNVSHRVQSFLANPSDSPLEVSNYFQPRFWRHDGCRGAGFLFLNWCLEQGDPEVLKRLVASPSLDVNHLERATGRTMNELFQGWTTELGHQLANRSIHPDGGSRPGTGLDVPTSIRWSLTDRDDQEFAIKLRGSCITFVEIESEPDSDWQLSIRGGSDHLQATLIPVTTTAAPK
jgi:hypothetical protein